MLCENVHFLIQLNQYLPHKFLFSRNAYYQEFWSPTLPLVGANSSHSLQERKLFALPCVEATLQTFRGTGRLIA